MLASVYGCSGTRETSRDDVVPAERRSRDGLLQYAPPHGWFDATADSQAAGHAVWIIRNDYVASITIDEVRLDAAAQATALTDGLEPIARLLMTLPSGDRPVRTLTEPATIERKGRVYCGYLVEAYGTNDLLSVVLFRADERVYSSTLVVPREARERGVDELVDAQAAFLGSVAWSPL
jgi:hypothetical protein